MYKIYSLFGQNAKNTEFIENTCRFCGKSAIPAKIIAVQPIIKCVVKFAGSFREQCPRIQRDAADDDCRPDHVRRGDGLAKHIVREQ